MRDRALVVYERQEPKKIDTSSRTVRQERARARKPEWTQEEQEQEQEQEKGGPA
jgi:hypothetical protein